MAGAAWFGLPEGRWPGLDLDFGPAFWALLPGFVFITLVSATKSIDVAVAIQRVSWRRPRAVDFRAVQGAVAANGTGNVLAGLAGTTPNAPYPVSVSLTELTGVATGASAIVLAFLPKVLALILAIPASVVAVSIMVVPVISPRISGSSMVVGIFTHSSEPTAAMPAFRGSSFDIQVRGDSAAIRAVRSGISSGVRTTTSSLRSSQAVLNQLSRAVLP